ncbi:BIRC2 [Branchiostoma lanceolatum]|uniref:BIRC2 protein n=1 Tax=Branchiostoma lanceolatum TaxID=7740 RepID=A0A8J9VZD2_BRALA|nr:BIRC2 [Branchiostoma lanceolatum]
MLGSQHPPSSPSPSAQLSPTATAIQPPNFRPPHLQEMSSAIQQSVSPKHTEMKDELARLGSFVLWPYSAPVSPRALAKAGFFYTDIADQVRCFWCDGGLKNWEPGDDPWEEHAKWYPQCEFLLQRKGEAFVRAVQASRSPLLNHQGQQNVQHGLEPALDSRWFLYQSGPGHMHLYDSHLGLSLPLSSGKHQDRFEVLVKVKGQVMVVVVALVEFLKNPPSPATKRQVQVPLGVQKAVMENLREVLFNNSTEFPDLPCQYKPGGVYLHRLDRTKKVVVSSAAHANLQRDTVVVAPINETGTADINQITSAKKEDLIPTSDVQYYDISRLLDDLDRRFFSALGPDPHQICTDLANMSVPNPTWTDRSKLPVGWLSEQTLPREVSRSAISAQARNAFGPGYIPKSTTFLHTVDQRRLRHESKRLETFADWPQHAPVKSEALAAAGFFYTGKGDNTQCCICGNVISHWKEGDDPVLKHFYLFPDCEFILGYGVGNVPVSSSLESQQETVPSEESEVERLKEERLCKICMEEETEIVFVPCGHFAVCQNCSASLHCCPICRKDIDRTVRTYMA